MGEVLRPGDRGQATGDRPRRLLVAGGTVWGEDGARRADVLVENGRIAAVGLPVADGAEAEVVDAAGLHVLPGLIDVHVHAGDRVGRFRLADDIASASEVAVCTGITTFATFATERPNEGLTAAVTRMAAEVRRGSWCDVALHVTPTAWPWRWDELARLAAAGCRTVKLYTTYREAGLFTNWDRLAEVMRRLAAQGVRLLLHAEDDALLAAVEGGALDRADPFSHTLLRPERVEVEAIRRAVALAAATGCALHVVHVSTADGAALVAEARQRARVTCETAPHYLLLSDQRLRGAGGHRLLCTPPLRSEATRSRLESLVTAGAIDLLATDHCPFTAADKDSWDGTDHRAVPNGIPGLGTLVPLAFESLVRRHRRPLSELVRLLSANPARLLGLYPRKGAIYEGSDADLVVFDPDGPQTRIRATLADVHDPWADRSTMLTARDVMVGGELVVRDGALLSGATPPGRVLADVAGQDNGGRSG